MSKVTIVDGVTDGVGVTPRVGVIRYGGVSIGRGGIVLDGYYFTNDALTNQYFTDDAMANPYRFGN